MHHADTEKNKASPKNSALHTFRKRTMRQHSTPENSILSWVTFGITDFLSFGEQPQPLTANSKVLAVKSLWQSSPSRRPLTWVKNITIKREDSDYIKPIIIFILQRLNGLIPLTFRSLNLSMWPSARMPRGFSHPAMSGGGADCRTHWYTGISPLLPDGVCPTGCARSTQPWWIWRIFRPWNCQSNSLCRSLILRSHGLLGAFGNHLNSIASHDPCDECSPWEAGVRPRHYSTRGLPTSR